MPTRTPNKFTLIRARELRKRMTLPERILWQFLRGSGFAGLRFRRQHPIGIYIVDFYCPHKKLIIELDGKYHDNIKREDKNRDAFLKASGCRVLHFSNDHVFERVDWILQTIAHELAIEWKKNYHDCIACVKHPQRLYALFEEIKRYQEKFENATDAVFE